MSCRASVRRLGFFCFPFCPGKMIKTDDLNRDFPRALCHLATRFGCRWSFQTFSSEIRMWSSLKTILSSGVLSINRDSSICEI